MRFLTYDSNNDLRVTRDLHESDVSGYAILSHTWGNDEEEVKFHEIGLPTAFQKPGYKKIDFCGKQAFRDGWHYFWVDTCCIDKANHTELSKAITSMYRWYQQAQVCYVYLSDVTSQASSGENWQATFRRSRWFTRGWTLQELLAPRNVEFYSKEWDQLGTKEELKILIHEVTGIPIAALAGQPLSEFPIMQRMQWMHGRQTKEPEDQAYCLLGIFSIYLWLNYGEGDNAMLRLQKKLDKQSWVEVVSKSQQPLTLHLDPKLIQYTAGGQQSLVSLELIRHLAGLQQVTRIKSARATPLLVTGTNQRRKQAGRHQKEVIRQHSGQSATPRACNAVQQKDDSQPAFAFRIPLWKVWKCFEMSLNWSYQSLGFTFRVYNMRSNDSDFFQAANNQQWEVVYQMLAKREGSIFDIDEWGNTLLHIAASQAKPKVCQFLLSNGLEASRVAESNRKTPLKALCSAYRPITDFMPKVDSVLQTARLLMPPGSEDPNDLEKELRSWFHRCSLPADGFSMLIPIIYPSYDSTNPLWRANLVMSTTSPDPGFVTACLGSNLTLEHAFKLISTPPVKGYGHRQILFNICRELSRKDITDEYRAGWLKILASVISFETKSIKPDAKLLYRSLYSIFIAYYMAAGSEKHLRAKGMSWNEIMTSIGKIWLKMLVTCGADLGRYAAAEKAVLKHPETIILPGRRGRWHCHKVKFLTYGPNIDDWHLFVVPTFHKFSRCERPGEQSVYVEGHAEYEMAGSFWHMVENPELFHKSEVILDQGYGVKSTVGKPVTMKGPIF